MRKHLLVVAILAAVPLVGCGDETGYHDGDEGLNTPAQEAPPASGTSAAPDDGSGLLHPRRKNRPERRKKHEKKAKKKSEKGEKKAEQEVAGERRESTDPIENVPVPLGSVGDPEADPPTVEQAPPSLTADQRAELESVRVTLRELFTRMNARDGSLCTDLLTQRHVEEATGMTGPAAVARCRDDVSGSKASYSINKISGVRIEGGLALIRFASSIGDYASWQVLRAARNGSGWRFDGDGSADA